MNTNTYNIKIGNLQVQVVRKPIKNLHLSVLPPNGRLRISAPLHTKDDAIRMLIATRIPWINKQKAKFDGQDRQTPRDYVSGESHYFWGRRYLLEVVDENKPMQVALKGKNKIVLQIPPNYPMPKREEVMMRWLRKELRKEAAGLFEKWQKKIGVKASSWGIKRMKTRWGTCNHGAGRIWINLELAKKSIAFTEYIIVHELVHLIEKNHNERFVDLMTKYLPKWRSLKEELNRFILSHEEWKY
jgi:predicted metal-dependent hydrolase